MEDDVYTSDSIKVWFFFSSRDNFRIYNWLEIDVSSKKMSSSLLQTMLQPYARQSSSSLDGVVKIQFLFMVMKYGPYQLNVSFSLFGKKINCIYKLFSWVLKISRPRIRLCRIDYLSNPADARWQTEASSSLTWN